ncbi:putative leucine-rich repeat domain, L domain-containing protein [Medicago truncatula]|uniref:Putative leucine-rich repeat domain, L domain-containing protein n=1 Tax=Medicago truncatula TaxID=3880 RepID=A0A396GH23_MEDTR|nr:putative leucine-rich repeat domain, L domain-containing protein [Medicago truncatula]
MNDQSLLNLFKNWKFLEEAIILNCQQITNAGIASALLERQTLRSLSFTSYFESDNCSKLFALVKHFPSLTVIRMNTCVGGMGENNVENSNSSMNFVVNPQFKSLHLPYNSWLRDESLIKLDTIFPNLQLLDLRDCNKISEKGICQVLRGCSNIRHLNLGRCSRVKLHRSNEL